MHNLGNLLLAVRGIVYHFRNLTHINVTRLALELSAHLLHAGRLTIAATTTDARRSPRISHIVIYPVESCAGIQRYSVEVTLNGLIGDRQFAIVKLNRDDPSRCTAFSQTRIVFHAKRTKYASLCPFG